MSGSGQARSVAAGEVTLDLLAELSTHGPMLVTVNGTPVAELKPLEPETPFEPIFGRSRSIELAGDDISPLPQEWTLPQELWE